MNKNIHANIFATDSESMVIIYCASEILCLCADLILKVKF